MLKCDTRKNNSKKRKTEAKTLTHASERMSNDNKKRKTEEKRRETLTHAAVLTSNK